MRNKLLLHIAVFLTWIHLHLNSIHMATISRKMAQQTLHRLKSEDVYPLPRKSNRRNKDRYYHHKVMRPAPSDTLPVEPPDFPLAKGGSLPTIADKDTFKLKRMLGNGFNAEYMALERPLEKVIMPNGTLDYTPGETRGYPIKHMDSELKTLAVRIPGRSKKLKIRGERTKKRVLRFLSAYSYCPVQYQWKKMGGRFWPPWLKEGSCYQGRSCSIPPGMSCRPRESLSLSVLWWHCSYNKHKYCKWISIQYPIITSCTCAC